MERGAWQVTVHGVARVGHDLVTEPPPPVCGTSRTVLTNLSTQGRNRDTDAEDGLRDTAGKESGVS